jgi:thymidylate synthase
MNKLDLDYQALLKDILENGVVKENRNGGTLSVFGRQIRHKMSEGFPLLTTKKMYTKGIITELLWFLNGDTNIKYLIDNDCNIWNGDAYNYYKRVKKAWMNTKATNSPEQLLLGTDLTMEEFIEGVKSSTDTDSQFGVGYRYGDLGPVYGKQWRKWGTGKEVSVRDGSWPNGEFKWKQEEIVIDQISKLIYDLENNPDSRRMLVNAWNVAEVDNTALHPCHYGFQCYTRELSIDERYHIFRTQDTNSYKTIKDVPIRAISLKWNQRSVDTFLGLPFNIASYGLLLEIIAKRVNMVPDELIGDLGDTHIYLNHIEQAKEQIGHEMTHKERFDYWFHNNKPNRDVVDELDEWSENLQKAHFDKIGVPTRTREPFELPTIRINDWASLMQSSINDIKYITPYHIRLSNYQSHPSIKAPLSN